MKNRFGQPYQVVRRQSVDRGSIRLFNTADDDTEGTVFTRVRSGNTKLMVFSVDSEGKIIGSKGLADSLNDGKKLYGANLEFAQ